MVTQQAGSELLHCKYQARLMRTHLPPDMAAGIRNSGALTFSQQGIDGALPTCVVLLLQPQPIWNSHLISSSLSSVSFPICILDKCLSISASSVVMNRHHVVLALQENLSTLCPLLVPFYCAEAFSSCSSSPPFFPWSGVCISAP